RLRKRRARKRRAPSKRGARLRKSRARSKRVFAPRLLRARLFSVYGSSVYAALASPISTHVQIPGARFEDAPLAFSFLRSRFLLQRLQVRKIRQAKRTRDRLQVKIDIVLPRFVEHLQKVAAELLARRAGEPFAPPNGAQGMLAAVALLHDEPQEPAQRLGLPQGLFDLGRFCVAERVIEVSLQVFSRDFRHGHSSLRRFSSGKTSGERFDRRTCSVSFLTAAKR